MTLGHEGVGTVAALGAGVTAVTEGEAVTVYGPWGCGRCHQCAEGRENCCPHAPERTRPGAAAPLTDAGLTPYHAIRGSLPKLLPGSTAVVIGPGVWVISPCSCCAL